MTEKLESVSRVGKSESRTRSSHGSSRSGRSSTRSAQLREKAKIAEMLAAKEMLAKQKNIARKKQELAFEEETVKVETELAKALAWERVFATETERDETKRERGEADAMNKYLDAHLSKANVSDPKNNGFTQADKATDTDRPRGHVGQSTEQLKNERSGLPDASPSQHPQGESPGRPAAPTHVMESANVRMYRTTASSVLRLQNRTR